MAADTPMDTAEAMLNTLVMVLRPGAGTESTSSFELAPPLSARSTNLPLVSCTEAETPGVPSSMMMAEDELLEELVLEEKTTERIEAPVTVRLEGPMGRTCE